MSKLLCPVNYYTQKFHTLVMVCYPYIRTFTYMLFSTYKYMNRVIPEYYKIC
jgi:hypothetical protein